MVMTAGRYQGAGSRIPQASACRFQSSSPTVTNTTTLFRPEVVSSYQAARVSRDRKLWQVMKIATALLTVSAGMAVALGGEDWDAQSVDNTVKPNVLTPLRKFVRAKYEEFVKS